MTIEEKLIRLRGLESTLKTIDSLIDDVGYFDVFWGDMHENFKELDKTTKITQRPLAYVDEKIEELEAKLRDRGKR